MHSDHHQMVEMIAKKDGLRQPTHHTKNADTGISDDYVRIGGEITSAADNYLDFLGKADTGNRAWHFLCSTQSEY